jgi:hypothetical protein
MIGRIGRRRGNKIVNKKHYMARIRFKKINKVRATKEMFPKLRRPSFYVWYKSEMGFDERALYWLRNDTDKHFVRRLL